MIYLKQISTKKEMKQFVTFPFLLYKKNKYWVPPIIKDELNYFNPKKNPVFNNVKAYFFIAIKNHKIVGRVVAIINNFEVETQKIKKIRFGWFDVINDIEVTKILLNKVKEIGREHNLSFIEGPVGFNNLDKTGVLVEGFNHIGTMITWYNFPYYKDHLEKLGFLKEKEWTENKFEFNNINRKYYNRLAKIIKKRYNFSSLNLTKTKDILPYIDEMFEVLSKSYSKLSSFVPFSKEQIQYFKKKYINFINPEYVNFVVNNNNKLIAFAIVMPSFSIALQKAKGKIFPFGIFHLLKAKKKSKEIIFYLIGVNPEDQNKGVYAIIFDRYFDVFNKKNVKTCIRTPELVDNKKIEKIWTKFNSKIHKRRRTYRLDL